MFRQMITRVGHVWWVLMALAVVIAACDSVPAPDTDDTATVPATATPVPLSGEAVIYVVAPLSGERAQQGQAQSAGARLAASILNEQGGINGQEIVVRTINDRNDAAYARQVADEIVAEAAGDNVVGVIVSESSDPQLQAVRDTYLSDQLDSAPLVVVPVSTNPLATTLEHPRFFRLTAPSITQASEIAAAFSEGNVNDVVTLQSPTDESQVLAERFQTAASDFDITISDTYELSPFETNFTEMALQIFEQNPAGLFLATNPYETGQILSALYAINYQGSIYAADQALPYAVVDELGCQAEGIFRSSVVPVPRLAMTPAQRQRYAQDTGREPEPFSVAGYAAVEFIAQAYNASDGDPTAAVDFARNNPVPTLLGDLTFSADGEREGATMHFQQVQGRIFEDEFQRVVGTVPQASAETGTSTQTYLDRTFAEDAEPIIFADLNWNSALFHNGVARYIIEAGYDVPTQAIAGSTVPSFQRLTRGEVDIIMERYNFDDTVSEALASGQIVDLGVNFSDAVQGWFVPRYVVDENNAREITPVAPDLQHVDQLDQYTNTFRLSDQSGIGAFYGGVPGWTAHKINCLKLKAYQLDDNYAQVTSDSTSDLFGSLATAYDNGDPILLYLWAPTSVFGRYDLVQLEEPTYTDTCWATDRGCAYPTGDVRILASGDLPQRAPDVTEFLEAMAMDIDDVSNVLVRIEDESLTPDEAAIIWLRDNQDVWSQWVSDDVAARVRQSLADM